jgi:hypothetical protein
MMETEQISETQVFSPHVTRLIAREKFSERVHRESFKYCLCALLGCLWPLQVTVNCFDGGLERTSYWAYFLL